MSFWEEEAIQFLLEEEKDDELLLALTCPCYSLGHAQLGLVLFDSLFHFSESLR